jgi:hypothetical protein
MQQQDGGILRVAGFAIKDIEAGDLDSFVTSGLHEISPPVT